MNTTETEVKHTPGPWSFKRKYGALSSFLITAKKVEVCELDHWGERQPDLTAELKPEGEPEANARLIAAAPELLEACKAALCCQLDGLDENTVDALETAITKATGGTQ